MIGIWRRLGDAVGRHGKAAMVTVAATRGSVPREAGARMIVHPDGAFAGTIGGGTLEWRAIALAQSMLARSGNTAVAEVRPFTLGPDMGQCCGGQVQLLFEVLTTDAMADIEGFATRESAGRFATVGHVHPTGVERRIDPEGAGAPGSANLAHAVLSETFGDDRRPLLLFGAGHVGRALVLALAPLPFAVTWIDPRPDAFPSHLPANVVASQLGEPGTALDAAGEDSFVLVMTHSHQLDLALVAAALGRPFPYVGLIGSSSKRARFARQLASAGIDPARIAALVCPIGIDGIRSKLPAAIAAATVAELLVRDEALRAAVRQVPEARARVGSRG